MTAAQLRGARTTPLLYDSKGNARKGGEGGGGDSQFVILVYNI